MIYKGLLQTKAIFTNKKRFKLYLFLLAAPLCIYHSLAAKDFWTILFLSCLALYAPVLWGACGIFLCYKTHLQLKHQHLEAIESVQCGIVQCLHENNLQKLTEEIEANPEILYCEYQRRSLIAWCRYYKNTDAQELVIQMMKKYPKEQLAA